MGQTSSVPNLDVFKALREMRDAGMESWAKVAVRVTQSAAYSRVSSLLAKPALFAAGVARKRTDKTMTQLLAQANMPSRAEILALSTRLTHIEMTLDDLTAAIEALRAQPARPPLAAKRAANDRGPRPTPAQEG